MNNYMIDVPNFDANAARYVLALMDRVNLPGHEAQAFLTLRLSLEHFIKEEENTNVD